VRSASTRTPRWRPHEVGESPTVRRSIPHRGVRALRIGVEKAGLSGLSAGECAAPGDCHRHHLIAIPLLARDVDLVHVYSPRGEEPELIRASELRRSIDDDDEYAYETIATR